MSRNDLADRFHQILAESDNQTGSAENAEAEKNPEQVFQNARFVLQHHDGDPATRCDECGGDYGRPFDEADTFFLFIFQGGVEIVPECSQSLRWPAECHCDANRHKNCRYYPAMIIPVHACPLAFRVAFFKNFHHSAPIWLSGLVNETVRFLANGCLWTYMHIGGKIRRQDAFLDRIAGYFPG